MPPRKKKRVHKKVPLVDTWGRDNRKLPDIECRNCGKVFRPIGSHIKCCSRKCGYESRTNGNVALRKDTRFIGSGGYMMLSFWVDGKRTIVKEHRHLMEQKIGRKLKRNEIVHHKNEIITDNDINNLELMTISEHISYHKLKYWKEKKNSNSQH